jgi:hypothetical protein
MNGSLGGLLLADLGRSASSLMLDTDGSAPITRFQPGGFPAMKACSRPCQIPA